MVVVVLRTRSSCTSCCTSILILTGNLGLAFTPGGIVTGNVASSASTL